MKDPFSLTQEELDELAKLWEDHSRDIGNFGGPNHNCEPPEWYDLDYSEKRPRRRHVWKPILLLTTTVWNCENCGISREKAKEYFCEDEEF